VEVAEGGVHKVALLLYEWVRTLRVRGVQSLCDWVVHFVEGSDFVWGLVRVGMWVRALPEL